MPLNLLPSLLALLFLYDAMFSFERPLNKLLHLIFGQDKFEGLTALTVIVVNELLFESALGCS
jgi:hypothetical protein